MKERENKTLKILVLRVRCEEALFRGLEGVRPSSREERNLRPSPPRGAEYESEDEERVR